MIGGVGQRMLSGVAKKTAGEFFSAVDDVINGRAAAPALVSAGAARADGAPQTVFDAPALARLWRSAAATSSAAPRSASPPPSSGR